MRKYGYITNYDAYFQEEKTSDEVVWDFERKEENGTISNYIGIECTSRTDFTNMVIIGDADKFNAWLNEHGVVHDDFV
jgi:hypothetical protein